MRQASEEMGEQVSFGLPKGEGFGIFMERTSTAGVKLVRDGGERIELFRV